MFRLEMELKHLDPTNKSFAKNTNLEDALKRAADKKRSNIMESALLERMERAYCLSLLTTYTRQSKLNKYKCNNVHYLLAGA